MLIRLLSINIWDLPVPVPGFERRRRREQLLAQLPGENADLVLIQEAFVPGFKARLASLLAGYQPDAYLEGTRRHLFVPLDRSGGLLTFSRLGIMSSQYAPFRSWRGMKLDERIGRKGCLLTEVTTPMGILRVGNVHLYAGTRARDARVRALQVRHLLRVLDRLPPAPTLLAGDFNMSIEIEAPTAGPSGFELMREAGFTEVAAGLTGALATMSQVRNRFARFAPWAKPEQRLTQMFYRGNGIRLAEGPTLCFCETPVSDHFGLRATLDVG